MRNDFKKINCVVVLFLSVALSVLISCRPLVDPVPLSLDAPQNLKLESTETSVILTWDKVEGATSYKIYRSDYSSFANPAKIDEIPQPEGTNKPTFTVTDASKTKKYYKVSAIKGESESQLSSSVGGSLPAISAPKNFELVSTYTSVTLTWDKVEGATSYKIYRSASSSFANPAEIDEIPQPEGTNKPTFTVTDASKTKKYYKVSAIEGESESQLSSLVEGGLQTISAPQDLKLESTYTSVTLTWDKVEGATAYKIYKSDSSSFANPAKIGEINQPEGTNKPTFTVTDATTSTKYYKVSAIEGESESQLSSLVEGGLQTISAPQDLKLESTYTSVTLTWDKVDVATSYRIYKSDSSSFANPAEIGEINQPEGSTKPTFTVTDATTSKKYYKVSAIKGESESQLSSLVEGGLQTISAPQNIKLESTYTSVTLTWDKVDVATSYKIYRSDSSSFANPAKIGEILQPEGSTKPTFTVTDATKSKKYYKVSAIKGESESPPSSPIRGSLQTISAPQNLKLEPTYTSVTLTWDKVEGATSYKIYRSDSSSFANPAEIGEINQPEGTNKPTFTVTDATTSKKYYKVSAIRNESESLLSSSVEGRLKTISKPQNLKLESTYTSVTLTWDKVEGATSYKIYKGDYSWTIDTHIGTVADPTFTDKNATAFKQYYQVSAVLKEYETARSDFDDYIRGGLKEITKPSNITGSNDLQGKYKLTWDAVDVAESYEIYRGTSSYFYSSTKIGEPDTNSFEDDISNKTPRDYYYWVKTVLGKRSSDESAYHKGFVLGTPTLKSVSESKGGILISWNSLSSGPYNLEINVYRSSTKSGNYTLLKTVSKDVDSHLDASVTLGSTYYYAISVKIDENESLRTVPKSATLTGKVTGVNATNGTLVKEIKITWDAIADSYKVYYTDSENGTYILLAENITKPEYTHSVPKKAEVYYYKVSALVNGSETPKSGAVRGETFGAAPKAPTFTIEGLSPNRYARITFYPIPGAAKYSIGLYDAETDLYLGAIDEDPGTGVDTYLEIEDSPYNFRPPNTVNNDIYFKVVAATTGISPTDDQFSNVSDKSETLTRFW